MDRVWVWMGDALGTVDRDEIENSIFADSINYYETREDALQARKVKEDEDV